MSLSDDLKPEVAKIFRDLWTEREGEKVPQSEGLNLGNDAATLDATVLYADISESTALVDKQTSHFAAEIYKSFLHCAAKIIKSESGEVTAYDGDRVMAVFIGGFKNTSAVRTALKINYARIHIINPAIKNQYPHQSYQLQSVVGVDTSKLFVARTGVRGANDLVWVGRAANHAAKLCALSPDYATSITSDVYDVLHESVKTTNGKSMWQAMTWNTTNRTIYRSTWWWRC